MFYTQTFQAALLWVGVTFTGLLHAQTPPASELLQEVQQAARQLDYSGVLNYSNKAGVESMSLVHVVDGKGERERLAVLDGQEREYLRENDLIQCLIPEQKLVIMETPRNDRFPALLTGNPNQLEQYYRFNKGEVKRIAGHDCQQYTLRPIDQLRYGYNICIDTNHQLLLQFQTVDTGTDTDTNAVINQIAFAHVAIGKDTETEALSSRWQYDDWTLIAAKMKPTDLAAQGWRIPYPDGFEVVTEVSRFISSQREVAQLVLSDGLASISVFIEPVDEISQRLEAESGTQNNGTHLYRKRIDDYWLTVTGEAPLDTLHDLANHTEFVPPAQ